MRRMVYFILAILVASQLFAQSNISDYQRIFLPVYSANGDLKIAIRFFKINDEPSFLTVNPDDLQTSITPVKNILPRNTVQQRKPGYFTQWNVASTRYYQLLNKSTAAPYVTENQGITHTNDAEEGNVLTIDLCPSTKPFEADFFNALVDKANTSGKPVPITIAISGMWIIEHPDEFQWLVNMKKENKLVITWANHSFSHTYYSDLPYSENFLLSPGTNVNLEILSTEKSLLEAGEMPSVFFRFPGLISNKHLIKQLKQYGLIPLGADAWLAKRQSVTPGGVILVHGNSNEHAGILQIMPMLNQLKLLDIKNAI